MSQTETIATVDTTLATVATKAPSKKSRADAIFAERLADRSAGKYVTNKEFRAAVLAQIQAELGVSVASAATMYNAAKKAAEASAGVALGRDPKKEKPAGTGKRGRPAGSKNKAKDGEAAPALVIEVSTDPVVETDLVLSAEVPAADAAPAEAAA